MKYLLDTDHLSIIQRKTGQDYVRLATRMTHHPLLDFTVSVVTFHEQIIGSHTYIIVPVTPIMLLKGMK